MLALSIRQPYAELILRGVKTCELRGRATKIIGERFWIYAAKSKAKPPVWSRDLSAAPPPGWMMELARQVGMIDPGEAFPVGVIVGSAEIERITQTDDGMWQWHLRGVERAKTFRKPTRHPQPGWFRPFQ